MQKKVCVFTGTRAEYGLLRPLMELIRDDRHLCLQILATGMHLSPEFGLTRRDIEDDGFVIDEAVEILLSSDTAIGLCKSVGLGMLGFGEALARLRPDCLVILGDRFEALAAAFAAQIHGVPVAHIHGGEVTEGAMDDAFRHAISKMSVLHFVSTEAYRRRVIQLGENPARVFHVGALGIENIKKCHLLRREELEKSLGLVFAEKNVLVTFHPATLEPGTAGSQFQNLLTALDQMANIQVLFTKANADTDGRVINRIIDDYVARHPSRAAAFVSMGQVRYLSTMRLVDAVIGNSSSGIIEAPGFGVPAVNIGSRQRGRVKAASVVDCEPTVEGIVMAINKVFSNKFKKMAATVDNPYEGENTSLRIKEIIRGTDISDIRKTFYDVPIDMLERCHEKCQENNCQPPGHHQGSD
jgi:GDP/UDP-N,N'-diacetylbacillosamine 2-epimerase (hydrolysing)